jgi:hypothetical protein
MNAVVECHSEHCTFLWHGEVDVLDLGNCDTVYEIIIRCHTMELTLDEYLAMRLATILTEGLDLLIILVDVRWALDSSPGLASINIPSSWRMGNILGVC